MTDLVKWDYQASVEKVKPMVMNWRNLTIEIVEELYQARNELSASGRSWMSLEVPDGTPKTWIQYLDEVGLAKSTVHRWLERYEPTENRLMEPEEVERRKGIETRKKQDEATAIRRRIIQCKKTGEKPEDWDDKTEKEYQRTLKEDEERTKRIEAEKERMEKAAQNRENEKKKRESLFEDLKRDSDFLSNAADMAMASFNKRKEFKERIKVSQSGESDLFIEALMDYLDELESDTRRIEACQNIIKVCRNVANELQRNT